MQGAAVLGYLLAEGLTDAAARKMQSTATQKPVAQLPTMGDTESTYDPVDAATTNDVHPPDVTAKVGFEY